MFVRGCYKAITAPPSGFCGRDMVECCFGVERHCRKSDRVTDSSEQKARVLPECYVEVVGSSILRQILQ